MGEAVIEYVIQAVAIGLTAAAIGYVRVKFPELDEDYVDDRWTRADLSKVPPVIVQPEPRGHLLPWYRRAFHRAPAEEPPPRELTTYRD